ncbi:MAG: hypothetical protein AAFN59_07800 [Pseudomonadota bacterium]
MGDLYLHLGGHRTGSSSLQLAMEMNAEAFHGAGIDTAYPSRDGAQGGRLRLRLLKRVTGGQGPIANAERVRAHLKDHMRDDTRSLLVSDENVLGAVAELAAGHFYRTVRRRCRVLGAALWTQPRRVVLVTRPYGDLFASAYRFQASIAPVAPFEDVVSAMETFKGGWLRPIEHIMGFLKPQELVVVDYSKRGSSAALLGRLTGLEGLKEPARRVNLSATDAAIVAIQARLASGQDASRETLRDLVVEHCHDTQDFGIAAIPQALNAALLQRYEADLDEVSKRSDVTLVR